MVSPLSSRPRGLAVLLAALVLLAGCLSVVPQAPGSAPSIDTRVPGPGTVGYVVDNDGTTDYVVVVSVVTGPFDGVAVLAPGDDPTDPENATEVAAVLPDVTTPEEVPPAAFQDAVGYVPLGPDVQSRTYRFAPGGSVSGTFEGVPANATVVYSVGQLGDAPHLRAAGRLVCAPDDRPSDVSFRMVATGPDAEDDVEVGVGCVSGPDEVELVGTVAGVVGAVEADAVAPRA